MKGINAIFTTTARALAALALGCLCLLSCRKESTLGPDPEEQQQTLVTICISAGEIPASTRSDESGTAVTEPNAVTGPVEVPTAPATRADSETEDEGESFENYIDITKTHILFFIDDKFSEEFIPEKMEPVGSATYPTEWNLVGALQNPPTAGFKVVVLANCTLPTLSEGVTTIEDLCKTAVYRAYKSTDTDAFQPSASVAIPMYGIKTYDSALTFRPNIATSLGKIEVLRAMAKVIVRNTSGKPLTSVSVKGYNRQGTSAPLNLYKETSEWKHAYAYDNLASCLAVNLPNGATANETSSSSRSVRLLCTEKTATEEVWTGYFAEYLNANVDGDALSDCSVINLKFDGLTQEYPVDFRYYATAGAKDDGKRFDIKRNHIYEFDITKVDAYSLGLTLITKPWDVENHSYSYDDNVSAKDTGKQEWFWDSDGSEITKDPDNDHKMTFSNLGEIKLTFTIDTPVGAEWIAVFEQKSGDLNHFYFEETGTDRLTGIVDGNKTTVKIMQKDSNGSAKLVIYAHYGNISFKASSMLGGEYTLEKY